MEYIWPTVPSEKCQYLYILLGFILSVCADKISRSIMLVLAASKITNPVYRANNMHA